MKKFYLTLTVIAAAMLVSCEKEQPFNELTPLGENDIAFTMQGISTRSAEENISTTANGITIPIPGVVQNATIYLEETVEELNPSPTTKGAPAYTKYLGKLYTTMGVFAEGNFGEATFEVIDDALSDNPNGGQGWRYSHNYGERPWPADPDETVDFYLNMPATVTDMNILARSNQEIALEYTAPASGEDQQDLLFGQTSLSMSQHDGYLPQGAPIMMYHGLTGIKFRNGHVNDNATKTVITRVEIIGLKSKGKCFVEADGTVTWNDLGTPSTAANPFYLDFTNPTYNPNLTDPSTNSDGTVSAWDSNLTGTTWDTASSANADTASDHNLNKSDGSLTFWFIPQEMTNDVVLKLYFRVKTPANADGTEIPHTIQLGKLLNQQYQSVAGNEGKSLMWQAGQLRTYTLQPFHVDVDIKDNMDNTKTIKSNLRIINTGNVDQYVRVYIIGNWVGKRQIKAGEYNNYETVLMGYTDNAKDATTGEYVNHTEVARWNDKDFTWQGGVVNGTKVYSQWDSPSASYAYEPYGTFVGLPEMGDKNGPGASNGKHWIRHDKFFYYTEIIGPGQELPSTDPLFESYTIGPSPVFWIGDMTGERRMAKDVHFVMDVSVQAISVPYNGDTPVGYEDAWAAALGVEGTQYGINDL